MSVRCVATVWLLCTNRSTPTNTSHEFLSDGASSTVDGRRPWMAGKARDLHGALTVPGSVLRPKRGPGTPDPQLGGSCLARREHSKSRHFSALVRRLKCFSLINSSSAGSGGAIRCS